MDNADHGRIQLRPVDEETLERLLALAVADAAPEEVMPPVAGPAGWNPERQAAFRGWHRARRNGLAQPPHHEVTFAIVDGEEGERIVGSGRLARRKGPEVLETGLWLGRSMRGRGIGTAAIRALLETAAQLGARAVVADTTPDNAASLTTLRRNHAQLTTSQDGSHIRALFTLGRERA